MTKPIDGTDVYVTLPISLRDAILAPAFPFECTRQWLCSTCLGSGILKAPPPYGQVRCASCKGHGSVGHTQTFSVEPTPGQRDNRAMQFCYQGEGNCGFNGGKPGDLYVTVTVTPDERFEIRGKDLVCHIGYGELKDPLPTLDEQDPTSLTGFGVDLFGVVEEKGLGGYQRGVTQRGKLVYRMAHHDPSEARGKGAEDANEPADATTIASELLPSLDSLEKALDAMHGPGDAGHREGIELILDMQRKVLARHGIEVIPAVGRTFDPHWHEAVAMDSDAGVPKNRVTRVLQTGYRHGQRLLRPARVMVSG